MRRRSRDGLLQAGKLSIDFVACFELVNLIGERSPTKVIGLDLPLKIVHLAFVVLDLLHRFIHATVAKVPTNTQPALRSFATQDNGLLPRSGICDLLLQRSDVLAQLFQRTGKLLDLRIDLGQLNSNAALLDER